MQHACESTMRPGFRPGEQLFLERVEPKSVTNQPDSQPSLARPPTLQRCLPALAQRPDSTAPPGVLPRRLPDGRDPSASAVALPGVLLRRLPGGCDPSPSSVALPGVRRRPGS